MPRDRAFVDTPLPKSTQTWKHITNWQVAIASRSVPWVSN